MAQQQVFYRPEWTCGRYNSKSQVALMYNLIEGKSFFFESYSAMVIAEVLACRRNECIDIETVAAKTGIALDCIVDFFENTLLNVGLISSRLFAKHEIHCIRHRWSKMNKIESPHYSLSNLSTEQIVDPQTAEMEYNKYMDSDTQVRYVLFELTYRCSEKCIHCYNMGATRNDDEISLRGVPQELTLDDYKRVIDELDTLGCYKVCLSGGDPFAHPYVWDIIEYLYEKEIAFDIFTNGQTITTKVERLVDYYPRVVGISVYSGIPEVHDRITRVKGSFERSMVVARTLSEYGVPTAFKCIVMRPNLKSYHLVKDLAREYGAVIQIEANLCMGVDGDISMINHLRLTKEEFEILLRDKDIPLYIGLDLPNDGIIPKTHNAAPCSGGRGTYALTPDGNLIICTNMHYVFGNVKHASINQMLQTDKMKQWRSLSISDIEGCGTKPECDYCNLCSGNNYSEHHTITKPSNVNCWMAEVRYRLMQKLKSGVDPLNGLSVVKRLAQLEECHVETFGKEIIKH